MTAPDPRTRTRPAPGWGAEAGARMRRAAEQIRAAWAAYHAAQLAQARDRATRRRGEPRP